MKIKKIVTIPLCILTICLMGYGYYVCNNSIKNQNLTSSPDSIELSSPSSNSSEKSLYDLSFAVFGDIHDNEENFQYAIDDIKNTDIQLDALVLNGDTVDQGIESQYKTMKNILEKNKTNLPKTIIKNIGNHEFYDYDNGTNSKEEVNKKIQRYLDFAEEDKVYHDKWINNYHFISLGSEDGNSNTYDTMNSFISDSQFNWLKEKLSENYKKGRPIFVFSHQPLTLNWGWGDISGTNKSDSIKSLLLKYPEVILFTSHTHKQLSEKCYDDSKNYTTLQTGSISYTLSRIDNGDFTRSFSNPYGLYVTVIKNNVTISGRDIKNNQWLFSNTPSNK